MKVLAIPGSNRKKSFNKSAIRAAVQLAPEGLELEIFEIDNIPFMNQDLEGDLLPEEVKILINKMQNSDALLISTPEYNWMIPGIVKNTLEWLSRGYAIDSIRGKPLAIMGASDGGFGTVRAQAQLLQLGAHLGMRVEGNLHLPISRAQDKFDAEGNLTDEETKKKLIDLLVKLKNYK